jgi:hypothetical protein
VKRFVFSFGKYRSESYGGVADYFTEGEVVGLFLGKNSQNENLLLPPVGCEQTQTRKVNRNWTNSPTAEPW